MVGGWGKPGSAVDALNDRDLALVGSFSEVLADPRVLNLQMFHRPEDVSESSFPVLPTLLDWPCPALFGVDGRNVGIHDRRCTQNEFKPAVVADRATVT